MTNRNKNKILIPICIILIALIYYFSRPTKTLSFPKRTSVSKTKKSNSSLSRTKQRNPIFEDEKIKVAEFDCAEQMDKTIIKCDKECFYAFLKSKDPELYSFIEEGWFDNKLTHAPKSKLGRFLFALKKGGVEIISNVETDTDVDYSLKELKKIVSQDPQNIVPRIYLATILDMNGNTREAQDELKKASQLSVFNDYSLEWIRRLYSISMSNPQYVLHAVSTQSQLPIPPGKELSIFLNKHPRDGVLIARKMVSNGNPSHEDSIEMVDWSAIQYIVGFNFLDRYAPSEAAALPEFQELFSKKFEHFKDEVGEFPTTKEDCTLDYVERTGKMMLRQMNQPKK